MEAIRKAVERDRRQRGEVKKSAGRYAALSEREVIRLVNEGLMNNQIAERLGLSERTVESHRFHAYQKIGISTAKELRRFLEEAN
nr:LuxR C-terminal-related transcriptional regulator [Parasutterella muris]